jgi:acyl-CoA reductase-like NAD-dependent aldehyde dehydrogenase
VLELIAERRSYVAGDWSAGEHGFEVENPADETIVAEVGSASPAMFERAIVAARESFDGGVWAERAASDRAGVLHTFLDFLETQRASIVATCVAEAGQPTWFAEMAQFAAAISFSRNAIDLYLSMPREEPNPVPVDELTRGRVALSVRRYEPMGVVTAITPYNAAFLMAFQKIIPALMAGNSVVLRPSPLTPLSSLFLAMAADAAQLPLGVLSVLVEDGSAGAQLMSSHPAVDMVSFTGSTAVGRAILAQAAPTVKHVALELGGKSAQIYLPDAVDRVAAGAGAVVAGTCGQACVAATRMLVPRERKDDVLAAVSAAYGALVVGPPTAPGTMIGPLISAAQRTRCEQIVAAAEEAGGKVVTGGRRPAGLERGYYFEPTVLDVADNANPAAQQEIFGPVLSVIGYDDVDDAVRIANDSVYGLSAQVYGADVAAATAVARRIRSGAVNVNSGGMFSAYAPSGGYKQSGLGRERGTDGIRAFQELKHLVIGELPR